MFATLFATVVVASAVVSEMVPVLEIERPWPRLKVLDEMVPIVMEEVVI